MTSRVPSRGRIGQFETVVLENERIKVVLIPELGGRIWQLQDRLCGREWIWHRDDVPLARAAAGDSYDDVWAGGWEELFPNDAPGPFEERDLPDHGEWWTMAWDVDRATGDSVSLTAESKVIKAACRKDLYLDEKAAKLTIDYRIRSLENAPFYFLFKQHLPVRLTPACRLALPGGRVEAVDPAFGTLVSGTGALTWPLATGGGKEVDLRVVPPQSSKDREFVYVSDLPQPWCGVDDLERNASLRLHFDNATLPYVWLFLSYGGWRDTYTAVLEPCTNMPKDLGQASRRGQSARLAPNGEFVAQVSVVLGPCDPTQNPN